MLGEFLNFITLCSLINLDFIVLCSKFNYFNHELVFSEKKIGGPDGEPKKCFISIHAVFLPEYDVIYSNSHCRIGTWKINGGANGPKNMRCNVPNTLKFAKISRKARLCTKM